MRNSRTKISYLEEDCGFEKFRCFYKKEMKFEKTKRGKSMQYGGG